MEKEVIHDMDKLYSEFFKAMRARTEQRSLQGWSGWNEKKWYQSMHDRIFKNAEAGSWVDVANLAMFLWNQDGQRPI